MTLATIPAPPEFRATPHAAPHSAPRANLPLGERLLGANVITRAELEHALELQATRGLRLGEGLLELGVVGEEELLPFLEQQMNVPAVRLREGLIDPLVVRLLP